MGAPMDNMIYMVNLLWVHLWIICKKIMGALWIINKNKSSNGCIWVIYENKSTMDAPINNI